MSIFYSYNIAITRHSAPPAAAAAAPPASALALAFAAALGTAGLAGRSLAVSSLNLTRKFLQQMHIVWPGALGSAESGSDRCACSGESRKIWQSLQGNGIAIFDLANECKPNAGLASG